MPKVYMRFEWLAGWRVSFLDGDIPCCPGRYGSSRKRS